jgi:septal ring factor EnvC (AmiA/AmiB activator)
MSINFIYIITNTQEKLEKSQTSSHKQLTELEDEFAQVAAHRDELLKYIRSLEQSNDDLERAKR